MLLSGNAQYINRIKILKVSSMAQDHRCRQIYSDVEDNQSFLTGSYLGCQHIILHRTTSKQLIKLLY